ncbi:acyl-CoA thioesterase [Pseudomonas sp. SWRI79]|uniref:Acyl-CoA thioesterase n=1 Tax=Pseudomonas farris TaxID=2841207 RepID=A0ABS6PZA4_9PSED|nr:thioesterase family protein [Pseudomonas farris]MBV4465804.1 acyl-CoA thioesterase [Pseudomonas farris]
MDIATKPEQSPAFIAKIVVRWRDLDPMGHVNNAVYLTYLEEARLQFGQKIGLSFDPRAVPVMASSENHYRRPIEWPANLHVQLFIQRMGRTSTTLGHRIVDATNQEKLYCEGHVTTVWFNRVDGKAIEAPSQLRELAENESHANSVDTSLP